MKTKVKYLGYGANSSREMMEKIIGRKIIGRSKRLYGHLATLHGYELCVQTWGEIPFDVRVKLSRYWDQNFKAYCIRPKEDGIVRGYLWFITPEERELVKNWRIVPDWYEAITVEVKTFGGYDTEEAKTEMINDADIQQVVDGENYQEFLNNEEKMLEVAEKVRKNI